MNQSRRNFLKNASILSGAAGLRNMLPQSIQKAMAINANPGTTFKDAEHIVFLMQENRSFDHIFGTLRGVRGYNDPRAKFQPDGNKVWAQKDKQGNAYPPFHIDINKTNITWQGGLPHSWPDQTGARNGGKYDKWIPKKGKMTMGYFERSDLPFYYAFADAFTVCDHYFCSSLTGTTPNRLFFWTGNIRPAPNGQSIPAVHNELAESRDNKYVDWNTFPELLEENGVSWKIYQNELWTSQLPPKKDYWLANYGDNALEYVKRYNVKCASYFRKHGDNTVVPALTPQEVQHKYDILTDKEKNLIDKAFTTNQGIDDNYLDLSTYTFTDDQGKEKTVELPAQDIFRQFRSDVANGQLPTVSWLVAPQAFSDHTSSPLYGTWYVSEALDILTKNPEVWKKTIFILNYDENDGYFDHVLPFTAPCPGDINAGKVSNGIDTSSDFYSENKEVQSPIGLGYRVPMIIASPWSKGGYVNSQVFDHTSTLMFLETFLSGKGKKIHFPNISSWRRAICGDLTSAFQPVKDAEGPLPQFETREQVVQNIQNAYNKPLQMEPEPLSDEDIIQMNRIASLGLLESFRMPLQEKGTRTCCALPYRPLVDCYLRENGKLAIRFGNDGNCGIPFHAYTSSAYAGELGKCWDYAVIRKDVIEHLLDLEKFEKESYDLKVHGPNGFFRHFYGDIRLKGISVECFYEKLRTTGDRLSGNIVVRLKNGTDKKHTFGLTDNAYGMPDQSITVPAKSSKDIRVVLRDHHWYDFSIKVRDHEQQGWQYAGHVENDKPSISDPLMSGM